MIVLLLWLGFTSIYVTNVCYSYISSRCQKIPLTWHRYFLSNLMSINVNKMLKIRIIDSLLKSFIKQWIPIIIWFQLHNCEDYLLSSVFYLLAKKNFLASLLCCVKLSDFMIEWTTDQKNLYTDHSIWKHVSSSCRFTVTGCSMNFIITGIFIITGNEDFPGLNIVCKACQLFYFFALKH